jgi:preprotein translocase subunit SecG
MIYLLIVIHVVVCLFMIAVILLQQGKSADLAGAFGGQGSQTAFGPRSAANLLTRTTTWCAVVFMITSISLTVMMAKHSHNQRSVLSGVTSSQPKPSNK